MKDRPPPRSVPYTPEDSGIWARNDDRWCVRHNRGSVAVESFYFNMLGADRRDAELMYQRVLCTSWGGVKGGRLVIGKNKTVRRKLQS